MVITDVPFGRPNIIQDRYSLLLRPGARATTPDSSEDEDAQEYASFLKEKERKCGPDGFVDSRRLRNSFNVHSAKKGAKSKKSKKPALTVVDLAAIKSRDQKEYDKRVKTIEDHMWQHKQEERELKRVEGDVIKNQRILRKELRDYETNIAKKRIAEEKKHNQGLERFTELQRHHVHRKEQTSNQRKEQNMTSDQMQKDQGRKVQVVTNSLARNYRSKMSELELRRTELGRLTEEYEAKLRRKEEEQYKLKQELAELAIALNMEAQKGRVQQVDTHKDKKKEEKERIDHDLQSQAQMDAKLSKSDGVTKNAIQEKRKLSASLALTRAHLQMKQREESRTKYTTEQQLKSNQSEQRQMMDAAMMADLDLQQKKIDQKLTEVNSRKHVQMVTAQTEKIEKHEQMETHLSLKCANRFAEQDKKEHEDHLKHIQKMVQMGEDQEYQLYNKVKEAEYDRQKREQAVRKTTNQLLQRRRQNAQKIKKEMLEISKEERDIQYKLERQKADLAKSHAEREEMYLSLQKHRQQLRSDKYLLTEHLREHQRLNKIVQRTETMAAGQ